MICHTLKFAIFQMIDGSVGEMELNITRFGCSTLIFIPILLRKQTTLKVKKHLVPHVIMLAIAYFAVNTAHYATSIYIPVGNAATVFTISFMTMAVLVSPFKCCTGKEPNKTEMIANAISLALMSLGIILLIQPDNLFGHKPKTSYKSFCNPDRFGIHSRTWDNMTNETDIEPPDMHVYKGYLFGIAAGTVNTLKVHLGKCIFETEDVSVVGMWVAILNTILGLICTAIFENFVLPSGLFCNVTLICHAVCTGVSTVLVICVMKDIPATDISFINSTSPAITFIFQFTLLKNASPSAVHVNVLAISGAILISVIAVCKPLFIMLYYKLSN